ncbi:MAG: hypothetical protein JOY87_09985 [Candidatus Eremiobacteraeota bacterium]|nr:hypothetical protein [Candidatus Eremiobacteraeota bacterium]
MVNSREVGSSAGLSYSRDSFMRAGPSLLRTNALKVLGCLLRSTAWSFILSGIVLMLSDLFGGQFTWDSFYFGTLSLVLGGAMLWIDRYRRDL